MKEVSIESLPTELAQTPGIQQAIDLVNSMKKMQAVLFAPRSTRITLDSTRGKWTRLKDQKGGDVRGHK